MQKEWEAPLSSLDASSLMYTLRLPLMDVPVATLFLCINCSQGWRGAFFEGSTSQEDCTSSMQDSKLLPGPVWLLSLPLQWLTLGYLRFVRCLTCFHIFIGPCSRYIQVYILCLFSHSVAMNSVAQWVLWL